jgi:sugar phosphate isomerase/epimerase
MCLDLGHANIVADLRHTSIERLLEPVLDVVSVFHLHDNLGGRLSGASGRRGTAGLDPLRLDLHLPPGRGTLPWRRIAPLLAAHDAPLVMELHPPYRPRTADAHRAAVAALG